MRGLVALALLAAMLGAGTATAAKPKPPRLQDYCVTRAERKTNAVQFKASDGATPAVRCSGRGRRDAAS